MLPRSEMVKPENDSWAKKKLLTYLLFSQWFFCFFLKCSLLTKCSPPLFCLSGVRQALANPLCLTWEELSRTFKNRDRFLERNIRTHFLFSVPPLWEFRMAYNLLKLLMNKYCKKQSSQISSGATLYLLCNLLLVLMNTSCEISRNLKGCY